MKNQKFVERRGWNTIQINGWYRTVTTVDVLGAWVEDKDVAGLFNTFGDGGLRNLGLCVLMFVHRELLTVLAFAYTGAFESRGLLSL
jgi:hypothetical protein